MLFLQNLINYLKFPKYKIIEVREGETTTFYARRRTWFPLFYYYLNKPGKPSPMMCTSDKHTSYQSALDGIKANKELERYTYSCSRCISDDDLK